MRLFCCVIYVFNLNYFLVVAGMVVVFDFAVLSQQKFYLDLWEGLCSLAWCVFEWDEAGRMVNNFFCAVTILILRSFTVYLLNFVLMAVCTCQFIAEWTRIGILEKAPILMFIFLGISCEFFCFKFTFHSS